MRYNDPWKPVQVDSLNASCIIAQASLAVTSYQFFAYKGIRLVGEGNEAGWSGE